VISSPSKLEPAPPGDIETRAIPQKSAVIRWMGTSAFWVLLVDLALIVLFGLWSEDHVFWTWQNFRALTLGGTETLLLALGLAILLAAGIFDLSVGANLVLASVVGGKVMVSVAGVSAADPTVYHHPLRAILLGLLACLAAGALFGLVNGLIITLLDVNSIIATLGTFGIGTGLALVITNGVDISGVPSPAQSEFALRTVLGVPLPALVAISLAVLLWAVVRYTRWGLRVIALGSSHVSAVRAGLRTNRIVLSLTVVTGLFCGLAGFVDLTRYTSTSMSGHTNDALGAATAVLLGGTLLEGGRISIAGAVFGTAFSLILLSGLVIVGVEAAWQVVAIGTALVVAVGIDRVRYRRQLAA
jgi:ribose transport system permease protein